MLQSRPSARAGERVATLILGYQRYCYLQSLKVPLPNRWASLSRNYDAVSAGVKRHFPKVTRTTHYSWDNGYLMAFGVRPGTVSPAQAQAIGEYAFPKWVMIRQRSGMRLRGAQDCEVFVFDDEGAILVDRDWLGLKPIKRSIAPFK